MFSKILPKIYSSTSLVVRCISIVPCSDLKFKIKSNEIKIKYERNAHNSTTVDTVHYSPLYIWSYIFISLRPFLA